jgi:hypothetical protein
VGSAQDIRGDDVVSDGTPVNVGAQSWSVSVTT